MIALVGSSRLSHIAALALVGFLLSACSKENSKGTSPLEGKWISNDCQGNGIAVWFFEDELLWYQASMNTLFRKRYQLNNQKLEVFELEDGSLSEYPFSGSIYIKGEKHFWLSSTPAQVVVFERESIRVDSLEFYSVDDKFFAKRFY